MTWVAFAILLLELLLLLYVAANDIATRLIPNEICAALALLGLAGQFAGASHLVESLIVAASLFVLLAALYARGLVGGGDVKLLVALALGLPLAGTLTMLTVMALAGGVLALTHLGLRNLPSPRLAPAGASVLRRVYAVERWRNLRRAPLPYGAAIACGGIWSLLSLSRGF